MNKELAPYHHSLWDLQLVVLKVGIPEIVVRRESSSLLYCGFNDLKSKYKPKSCKL